jgi:hypothetical protein
MEIVRDTRQSQPRETRLRLTHGAAEGIAQLHHTRRQWRLFRHPEPLRQCDLG